MKINPKITKAVSKAAFTLKKESPLLLTITGGVGLLATGYFAYKSAPKIELIVSDMEKKQAIVDEYQALLEPAEYQLTPAEYETRLDRINELETMSPYFNRAEYIRRIAGAVVLPVCTAVISVSAIAMSYKIMNGRVGTLASVVSALTAEAAKKDRRMKEVLSEKDYKRVMAPMETKDITTKTKSGKEKVIQGDVKRASNDFSCAWFSDSSEFARDDFDYNMHYIDQAERRVEAKLARKGHILLNELYDELGLDRTKEGMLMGWDASDFFSLGVDTVDSWGPDGEPYAEILIKWTMPHYIYEDVDFDGRYSVLSN